jgi:L-xylulokinase
VAVSDTEEAAAWGAALCAGAGVRLFATPRHDPRDIASISRTYTPDAARSAALQKRYELHCEISRTLAPLWPAIEGLAGPE